MLLLACLAAWGCVGVAHASPAGNAPPPSSSPIDLETMFIGHQKGTTTKTRQFR